MCALHCSVRSRVQSPECYPCFMLWPKCAHEKRHQLTLRTQTLCGILTVDLSVHTVAQSKTVQQARVVRRALFCPPTIVYARNPLHSTCARAWLSCRTYTVVHYRCHSAIRPPRAARSNHHHHHPHCIRILNRIQMRASSVQWCTHKCATVCVHHAHSRFRTNGPITQSRRHIRHGGGTRVRQVFVGGNDDAETFRGENEQKKKKRSGMTAQWLQTKNPTTNTTNVLEPKDIKSRLDIITK